MTGSDVDAAAASGSKRRILKVRLRQDQVIRLHELRILKGTSIASLLEGILHDYFERHAHEVPSLAGTGAHALALDLEDEEEAL